MNWKRQLGINQILRFGGCRKKDGLLLQDFTKLIKKCKLCRNRLKPVKYRVNLYYWVLLNLKNWKILNQLNGEKQMGSMLLKTLWKLREKSIKTLNYYHGAYICSNHILISWGNSRKYFEMWLLPKIMCGIQMST